MIYPYIHFDVQSILSYEWGWHTYTDRIYTFWFQPLNNSNSPDFFLTPIFPFVFSKRSFNRCIYTMDGHKNALDHFFPLTVLYSYLTSSFHAPSNKHHSAQHRLERMRIGKKKKKRKALEMVSCHIIYISSAPLNPAEVKIPNNKNNFQRVRESGITPSVIIYLISSWNGLNFPPTVPHRGHRLRLALLCSAIETRASTHSRQIPQIHSVQAYALRSNVGFWHAAQ